MFSDPWRRKINEMIRQEVLAHTGREPEGRGDYCGVIWKALHAAGIRSDDEREELAQQCLAELFTKGGDKSVFELWDPERGRDFGLYLHARCRWRALSYIKERAQARTDMLSLTTEDERPEIQLPSDKASMEDELYYEQLLVMIEDHLQHSRPKLRLTELWSYLRAGESKGDIAARMQLRGPNITHRLHELRTCVMEVCDEHGLDELKEMLAAGVAHLSRLSSD